MKIRRRQQFETMPWPYGQGVAHEVFHHRQDGKTLLRLSLAEVTGDCSFSPFDGLKRCTTVVTGAGMDLTSPAGEISLRPLTPMTWDGALPLTGVLVDGPVENFNVVWDPSRLDVDVELCGIEDLQNGDIAFVLDGDLAGAGRHGAVWVEGDASGTGSVVRVRSAQR